MAEEPESFRIRNITERDLDVLAGFESEIAVISFGEEAVTDPEHHKKKIRKGMEKSPEGMLVLEAAGEVRGWLWMALQTNSVSMEPYIHFKSFYVKNGGEQTGYSQELMKAGMDYALGTGAARIVGKTFVSNLPMRLLYQKFRFKPTHLTMEYHISAESKRRERTVRREYPAK
jgi:RimJ/RimL family protein N-acetyltransferase